MQASPRACMGRDGRKAIPPTLIHSHRSTAMSHAARFRALPLFAATLLASLTHASLHAADARAPQTIDEAIKASAQQHRPVLLDFQAVWCYSCYYMASHVLNGPEWDAVQRKAIVVEVDADSPDGQAWMKKLNTSFLPSYVLLDEHGSELGRITAEQPRDTFYSKINAILATGNTLDGLKQKAAKGTTDDVANVLEAYQARSEADDGLSWFASLPASQQQGARKNQRTVVALDQLALIKAVAAKDTPAIIASAQKVLA